VLVAIGSKDFEQLEKSQKANTLEQLKRGRWHRYSRDEIKPVCPEVSPAVAGIVPLKQKLRQKDEGDRYFVHFYPSKLRVRKLFKMFERQKDEATDYKYGHYHFFYEQKSP
jgi:hypothetical protein